MRLVLKRYNYSPDYTEGRLYVAGEFYCWTLERPWLNNEPSVSCIPEGKYDYRPHMRPSGAWSYLILGNGCVYEPSMVDASNPRCLILIHSGNEIADSQGCILPGLTREPGHVWNSRAAMRGLLRKTNVWFTGNGYGKLTIKQAESPASPRSTPG